MSLKSLLQSGITTLFGGSVAPQSNLPATNNGVTADDIQTVIETMKKIKDMTQAIMLVQEASLQLRSQIDMDFPALDKLDELTIRNSEASVNTLLQNFGMIQKWDDIKLNDAMAEKINVAVFRPIAITMMKNYSDALVKCAKHSNLLEALDKIAPVENGEEISMKLKAALIESSEWSLKLHNVVFRNCNFAETGNAPQSQPA